MVSMQFLEEVRAQFHGDNHSCSPEKAIIFNSELPTSVVEGSECFRSLLRPSSLSVKHGFTEDGVSTSCSFDLRQGVTQSERC